MIEERLDRQLRIKGWDQVALGSARVFVLGDDDLLASLFALSASALGINDLVVLAPRLDEDLVGAARKINPEFNLTRLQGYYTHRAMDDFFAGCAVIVDLSRYGLANKLAIDKAYADRLPLVRAFVYREGPAAGFRAFTYLRGREWEELDSIVSEKNLPGNHFDDGVLDTVAAGVALEKVKNILMGWKVSPELVSYGRERGGRWSQPRVLVVGAGALGNFAALGLAYSGVTDITFVDPDLVEVANLNRQIFFYDAVGRGKAKTLASRLNNMLGTNAKFQTEYFGRGFDISGFDFVFDCVDNFETRILISEKCRENGKFLVSGGTSATAGQVVVYDPAGDGVTPAELLGLHEIVGRREIEPVARVRQSCRYRPDPSVIMTNEIVAGLMVDAFRALLEGKAAENIFYNSESDEMILK